jgi:hypothetical protein
MGRRGRRERDAVRKKDPDRIANPDIELRADVKAKAVRFEEKPEADVEFTGEAVDRTDEVHPEVEAPKFEAPEVEAGSKTERENLPEEVEPGVTYRDVRVRWHAAAKVTDSRRRKDR